MSNTHHGTVVNRPGIAKARKLAKQADQAEWQAEAYRLMDEAILGLDIDEETKQTERTRLLALAEEMYTEADDLRGQVDSELIDYL